MNSNKIILFSLIYIIILIECKQRHENSINKQINKFRHLLNDKSIYQADHGMVMKAIKMYFDETCMVNFNYSDAAQNCVIKKHHYRKNICSFKCKCTYLDKDYIKYNKNVQISISLRKVVKLNYCNHELGLNCVDCYDINKCTYSEQPIYNKCDYKSYYNCILFSGKYLVEKVHCNNHFNGTNCV